MSIKEHVETWQLLVREGERRETEAPVGGELTAASSYHV